MRRARDDGQGSRGHVRVCVHVCVRDRDRCRDGTALTALRPLLEPWILDETNNVLLQPWGLPRRRVQAIVSE